MTITRFIHKNILYLHINYTLKNSQFRSIPQTYSDRNDYIIIARRGLLGIIKVLWLYDAFFKI